MCLLDTIMGRSIGPTDEPNSDRRNAMIRQNQASGILAFIMSALIVWAASSSAQSVKVTVDPDRDIAKLHKYAWRENHILAKQTPEAIARIEATLKKAVDHELGQKGYVLDPQSPDFFIHFNAGSEFSSDASAVADPMLPVGTEVYKTQNPVGPGVNILPITTTVMRIIATSPSSEAPAWQGEATKKYKNPDKALKDLNNELTRTVKSAMKSFPPRKTQ